MKILYRNQRCNIHLELGQYTIKEVIEECFDF